MAVKVMVAPAIARGELEPQRPGPRTAAPAAEKKPRRRRSAVYDADGNEVFITLMCLKCHKMRPLSQFGLRKMADGAIRNQPWCRTCRSASGAEKPRRKGAAETVESPAAEASQIGAPEPGAQGKRASNPAAEVAAALAAGMRR